MSNDYLHLQMHNNRVTEFYQGVEHARVAGELPVRRRDSWWPRLKLRVIEAPRQIRLGLGHATITA